MREQSNLSEMTEEAEKRCPFDKHPCIRERCMVWDDLEKTCAFALIPRQAKGITRNTQNPGNKKDTSSASGLSGRFSDPLFG